MHSRLLALTFVFFVAPSSAHATPITWTISGLTFNDGATASGSFVFDVDTLTYSSVAITTTSGPVIPGHTYLFDHPDFENNGLRPIVVDQVPPMVGAHVLQMTFSANMTNGGGTLGILDAMEGPCFAAFVFPLCPGFDGNTPSLIRSGAGGTATAGPAPVPEPSSLLLLGAGALCLWRRRRT